MRLGLLALVPWMAMAVAWAQDPKPASVAFTHLGAFGQDVWRVGDECWVSPNLLQRWGWAVRTQGVEADIEAEGRRFRVPVGRVNGLATVNLSETLRQAGAFTEWHTDGRTLRVLGVVRMVSFDGATLRVDATLGVAASAFTLTNPERWVVDLKGARVHPTPLSGLPGGVRLGQYEPDVVRLVIEKPGADRLRPPMPKPGRALTFDLAPLSFGATSSATVPETSPSAPTGPSTPTQVAATQIGAPRIEREGRTETTLILPLTGQRIVAPTVSYLDPRTIVLRFANASVAAQPSPPVHVEATGEPGVNDAAPSSQTPPIQSEFVEAVDLLSEPGGAVRAVVRLRRALAYTLSIQATFVQLRLVAAQNADGRLAGKTIVLDAGHGGRDSGARAPDSSISEKVLTLNVARRLARLLSAEGANVIMTRDDDVRIPLAVRPAIANRSRADAFISIHFNSNRLANSRSGIITFHHRQDPLGRLLAQCLHGPIVRAARLPDIGVWSDTRIYSSGFAVLRDARMPSVLLELGFINHRTDRERMVTAEFQTEVAAAVVQGLKVFFGDEQASRQIP